MSDTKHTILQKLSSAVTKVSSTATSLRSATSTAVNKKITDLSDSYNQYKEKNPNSMLVKGVDSVTNNPKAYLTGAVALGLLTTAGVAFKKYKNIKLTKLEKERLELVRKEKMATLKAELEKSKLSAARKKKIMTLFLLGSVGAIILGHKVKSLKKGGSNKKLTLKK